jgi:hypothetical protein
MFVFELILYRELAFADHAKIRGVVRQGFERGGLQAENLSTKLDAQHRDELAFHGAHQRALISTLHANHNENQQVLVSLNRVQVYALNHQHVSRCIATRTQKETSSILRKLNSVDGRVMAASTITTASFDMIAGDIKKLLSLNDGSSRIQ